MKKRKLRRMLFDDYIWQQFTSQNRGCASFAGLFDDYIWQQFTSHRTRGSKYYLSNTQNRNPKQVPGGLWRDILLRQLREENFN